MFKLIFAPFRLVGKIISMTLSLVLLYFAVTGVQVWLTGREQPAAHAQAIVVFGTTELDGHPRPELASRLNEALIMWHQHRAPWIVVTGGYDSPFYSEAAVSATYLEHYGVPRKDILVAGGADTWQNVQSALPLLRAHDIRRVITVTDAFHEDRAMAMASSSGLQPTPASDVASPTRQSLWKYYAKETLEVGVGRIVGFGRLSNWLRYSSVARSLFGA